VGTRISLHEKKQLNRRYEREENGEYAQIGRRFARPPPGNKDTIYGKAQKRGNQHQK